MPGRRVCFARVSRKVFGRGRRRCGVLAHPAASLRLQKHHYIIRKHETLRCYLHGGEKACGRCSDTSRKVCGRWGLSVNPAVARVFEMCGKWRLSVNPAVASVFETGHTHTHFLQPLPHMCSLLSQGPRCCRELACESPVPTFAYILP